VSVTNGGGLKSDARFSAEQSARPGHSTSVHSIETSSRPWRRDGIVATGQRDGEVQGPGPGGNIRGLGGEEMLHGGWPVVAGPRRQEGTLHVARDRLR
jgi:hypothetical protein